jgi:hypothetical protein
MDSRTMNITLYTYNTDGIFKGSGLFDPLGPMPPGTLTPPPTLTPPQVAQWQGGEWTVLPEYPAAPAPELSAVRAQKWEAIKAIRDRKVQNGGYKVTVSSVVKWFHSDTFSRTQQMGLVMFGASCPAVPWKTLDGSYVTMSQALAGQIFQAAAVQDQLLFSKAEALKVAVYASTDPDSVDIATGWPDTYLGV